MIDQLTKDYDAVHIVFGRSVLGSMKNGLPVNEMVIGFLDIFSTGPIWDLHRDSGLTSRYEWLENHLLFGGEDVSSDKSRLREALLDNPDWTYSLRHSGEIMPEDLRLIYVSNRSNTPVPLEKRKQFELEWVALASTREVLRVWEDGTIVSVREDFYDNYIIATAQKLN